jgi:Domain of unknown function (DUF5615)
MALKYLMDENVDPVYTNQLRRQKPDLVVWAVGEPDTPAKGTLDSEILYWCEEHNFVLVTNNPKSMPVHLTDHIAEGHHMPGIFILNPKSTGQNLEELILLAEYSFDNEYKDQIIHVPIN